MPLANYIPLCTEFSYENTLSIYKLFGVENGILVLPLLIFLTYE